MNTLGSSPRAPFTAQQSLVMIVAWLGWGFDVFDAWLFTLVAPNAVPTLLALPLHTEAAHRAVVEWTGILTATLLGTWAVGGFAFGYLADVLGRRRVLVWSILTYSLGTAACAVAPNIWTLLALRALAGLGIGGEWAAGAAFVSEVVPEHRRVEAGAVLFTASPFGLWLASAANHLIAASWLATQPSMSWRFVLLAGAVPAIVALGARLSLRESPRWANSPKSGRGHLGSLLARGQRHLTLSGILVALVALVTFWTSNAYLPLMAESIAPQPGLAEKYKTIASSYFNAGGFVGALLTIPASKLLGRRPMFALYFTTSAVACTLTLGTAILPPGWRMTMLFLLGVSVYGVGGAFTYYLPELFVTRLRATGTSLCYNVARLIAAFGPLVAARMMTSDGRIPWIGILPLIGVATLPWITETKNQPLAD